MSGKATWGGNGKYAQKVTLTHYEANPGCVTEEEALVQDLFSVRHVNA